MRPTTNFTTLAVTVILTLATCGGGCIASAVGGETLPSAASDERTGRDVNRSMAGKLDVARAAFEKVEILTRKSLPPQFDVLLTRQMPTPGWSFDVEQVDVDTSARRIVARVRERRPDGTLAQVMTDTTCRVPLGAIEPGPWIFELWLARPGDEHAPAHAMVLNAR